MLRYFLLIFLLSQATFAQDFKFGTVSIKELNEKQCPIDATADAAVLYSNRKSYIDLDNDYGIVVRNVYTKRLKIYHKDGAKYARVDIPLNIYKMEKETVKNIKAFTYNLSGNQIIKTALKRSEIYREKTSEHIVTVKFTMPNIQDGSVVEWTYTRSNPFLHYINEIALQDDIPIIKTKAQFSFPDGFNFRYYLKGNQKYDIKKSAKKRIIEGRLYGNDVTWNVNENTIKIEQDSVPALVEEPFCGNIKNYRRGIKFELIKIDLPGIRKTYAISWKDVVKTAYRSQDFGRQLKKKSYFKKDLKDLSIIIPDFDKRLKFIFNFVKNKIKWNGKNAYFTKKGVVKAYKDGYGNAAEVNLNLINILNANDIKAYPVLVSTINHGIPLFPTITGFNYVIAAVPYKETYYLLDATDSFVPVNVLPERDLNFVGRLVEKEGFSKTIDLFPNDYSKKNITVKVNFDDEAFSGFAFTKMDKYFAYHYRKKLSHYNKNQQSDFLAKRYKNLDIKNYRLKNVNQIEDELIETIQFNTEDYFSEIGNKILISPMLFIDFGKNPFQSDKRNFPVFLDFPRIIEKKINIKIPENYKIKHLPENKDIHFGDKFGSYHFKIEQYGQTIKITSVFVLTLTVIDTKHYQDLKSFYDQIVKKQHEAIVLEKK